MYLNAIADQSTATSKLTQCDHAQKTETVIYSFLENVNTGFDKMFLDYLYDVYFENQMIGMHVLFQKQMMYHSFNEKQY